MLRFIELFPTIMALLNGYAPFFMPFSDRFQAQKWVD
jgi:hypothetical protein